METIKFKNMKIAKYLMMLAAAAGLAVACQKEEKVVFDPAVVVAPVLDPIADMVVTDDNMNDKVKFTWSAADFGLNVVVNYTLVTSYADSAEVALVKGVTATEAEVALATLNGVFFNDMKMPAGEAKKVKFRVFAHLTDSENYYSEAVEANFTAKEAEKVFPPSIYGVVGTLNGWAAPDVNLGDAGDGMYVAKNVVFDQGTNWFKIRANEEWVDAENYGLEAKQEITVDAGFPLTVGGGSQDIGVADGTYDVWFDKTNMMVYAMTPGKHPKDAGQGEVVVPVDPATLDWYIVGQFNNWTPADANAKLTKDEDGKWFVLKGFVADGQGFKFHAAGEDNWAVNRGAEGETDPAEAPVGEEFALVANGKNISLPAGTYDVYVSSAFDKVMFFEPGNEPAKYVEWIFVPGNHQGWSPATAPALRSENKDGIYTGFVNFNGDFKFTHVREWDKGEYNSDHFETYADGFAASDDGKNITAPEGYYYVTVNVPEKKLEAVKVVWGVIGDATKGGWDADQDMTWNDTDKCWTAEVALTATGSWKFRANDDWPINLGGAYEDLTMDGGNMTVAEDGTYTIKLYTERTKTDKFYCTVTKK